MECPVCGSKVKEGDLICNTCGSKLDQNGQNDNINNNFNYNMNNQYNMQPVNNQMSNQNVNMHHEFVCPHCGIHIPDNRIHEFIRFSSNRYVNQSQPINNQSMYNNMNNNYSGNVNLNNMDNLSFNGTNQGNNATGGM